MAIGSGTALGWGALLGFADETTWGTRVAATEFLEFRSESFKKDAEEEKLESLGTGRAFARRVQKQIDVTGSLEYDLHPVQGIKLLKHALMGTVTSTQVGATVAYNHTFTASDLSTITQKGLSFEKRPGSETSTAFYYTGCRVNSLKLSAAINEPVKCSVEFMGKDGTTGAFATTGSVSYSTVRPFLFQDGTFGFDGTIASMTTGSFENIIAFELEINNNLQGDESARSLGDRTRTALPPGKREIKLNITQRFDTTTAWDRFRNETRGAIRLRLDTGQTIGTALTTYAMFIDLPAVYYNIAVPEISDSGILTHEIDITSIGDTVTSASNDIIFSLTNSVTAYA